MLDRIAQIRSEAEAAISAAPDADALDKLRVRYLGRRSELTSDAVAGPDETCMP